MNKISMQIVWPVFTVRLSVVGCTVENVARHLHVCISLPVLRVGRGFLRTPVLAPPVGHPPFSSTSSGSSTSKSYLIDDDCAVIRDTIKALIAARMSSNFLLLFWVWFSPEKRAILTPRRKGVPPC